MAGRPVLPVRHTAEQRARWEAHAAEAGVSLSEFIRAAADAACGFLGENRGTTDTPGTASAPRAAQGRTARKPRGRASSPPPSNEVAKREVARRPGARTEMCVHRRKPDEYCARCDG